MQIAALRVQDTLLVFTLKVHPSHAAPTTRQVHSGAPDRYTPHRYTPTQAHNPGHPKVLNLVTLYARGSQVSLALFIVVLLLCHMRFSKVCWLTKQRNKHTVCIFQPRVGGMT